MFDCKFNGINVIATTAKFYNFNTQFSSSSLWDLRRKEGEGRAIIAGYQISWKKNIS